MIVEHNGQEHKPGTPTYVSTLVTGCVIYDKSGTFLCLFSPGFIWGLECIGFTAVSDKSSIYQCYLNVSQVFTVLFNYFYLLNLHKDHENYDLPNSKSFLLLYHKHLNWHSQFAILNATELLLRSNRCFQRLKLTHQYENKINHGQNVDILMFYSSPDVFLLRKKNKNKTVSQTSPPPKLSSLISIFSLHMQYSIHKQILQNVSQFILFLPPQQEHTSVIISLLGCLLY